MVSLPWVGVLLGATLVSCTFHPAPKHTSITALDLTDFVLKEMKLISRNITDPMWLFVKNDSHSQHRQDINLVNFYREMGQQFSRLGDVQVLSPSVANYSYSWRIMTMLGQLVEMYYSKFKAQLARTDYNLWRKSWLEFCHMILYDKNSGELTSVPHMMDRISSVLVDRDNFYLDVYKELEGSICSTEMSPQQLIYNLYSTLQVTQVKAYVMMQFSWTLLHLYGKGNFTTETELLQAQFKERLVQQMGTVQAAMSSTSNMVYKCDPKTHIQGQTYTQLTMLLQGYLVNVVDLNGEASCRSECAAYSLVPRQYDCYKNEFCARQKRCEGTILNCQFYDSDMTLCASPKSANSTRRYEWIQYENGVTLGKKSHCLTFEDTVDSWWRFYIPPHHCTYCMCLCDAKDNPRSDRYWSLRPVESDISNNKIMVGIRFIKLNKVVHLQIRQATLLPKLLTNTSTAEWIPVNPMDVSDRIRFRLLGSHLNLEVRATQFDYETGQLFVHKSFWFGNSNTDANMENPRTLLNVDNLDVPTVSSAPSRIDSVPDSYLLFTNSDLDRDVGQTTLPYIDIQPVTTEPLSPLSGAGVYHKSMPGYGGYVAPRLFTYDASEFLSPDIFRSKK
ncbi:hypothetical protein M8J76_000808 [Diaphorina citri]|nr:hypothetical protein M8J76_000808 [Diaphorina citri]